MSKSTTEKKSLTQEAHPKLLNSAMSMGGGTLVSRILGFARDIALVGLFPQLLTDSFVLGFRIPNFFRRVMGEGALAVSFIPRFLELKLTDSNQAEILKNTIFTFLFFLSAVISVFGIVFMDSILTGLLSMSGSREAFSDPHSFSVAVIMGQWMFFYVFLVTQFAYVMAVLNAYKRFAFAGFAPAFFNIGFLLAIMIPDSYVFFSGFQLAIGVLLGGVLQLLIVTFDFYFQFKRPKFNFNFNFKPFKKVLLATLPSVAGIGVLQLISIINIGFCAQAGQGAFTYLYLADRVLELPQSLIAVSLGTAMLPNLSELWVSNRKDFDATLIKSIRYYLFFSIPAAIGLFFLALPITQLLFQRGETSYDEAVVVASLIQIYGFVLVVSGLNRMILPVYYSFKNTWFPALASVFVVTAHYFVGSHLVGQFGLKGIVATTLLSAAFNFILLFVGLKFFINRSYIFSVFKAFKAFVVPALVLVLFIWGLQHYIPTEKNFLFYFLTLFIIAGSVFIYFACSMLLKLEESRFINLIFKKIYNKL